MIIWKLMCTSACKHSALTCSPQELNMWHITGTSSSTSMTFMCKMEVCLLFLLIFDTYTEVINKIHSSDYKEYFWVVMPHSLAEVYCFRWMAAIFYQTTQPHIPEDSTFSKYDCNTASLRKPAQAIMILTCIRAVLSPDLSLYADYPEDFHGFLQFPQASTRRVHWNRPWPLPSMSFQIHHSLIILPFNIT
jgi:hypothetical protein